MEVNFSCELGCVCGVFYDWKMKWVRLGFGCGMVMVFASMVMVMVMIWLWYGICKYGNV